MMFSFRGAVLLSRFKESTMRSIVNVRLCCIALFVTGVLVVIPAISSADDFNGFSVISESPGDLTLEVRYSYSGSHGENVFMSAWAMKNGVVSKYVGYNGKNCPSGNSIKAGRHKSCINLTRVQGVGQFGSDGVKFCMYDRARGKEFYCESFAHKKSWGSQQVNSIAVAKKPELAVVPSVTKIPAIAKQNIGRLSELTFSRLHIDPKPENDRLQRLELHMSRSYRMEVTVVNNGDVTTPKFKVRTQCIRDGRTYMLGEKDVTKIQSGYSVQAVYDIFPSSAGVGGCVMQTIIDADRQVPERDESSSSNVMQYSVLVVQ